MRGGRVIGVAKRGADVLLNVREADGDTFAVRVLGRSYPGGGEFYPVPGDEVYCGDCLCLVTPGHNAGKYTGQKGLHFDVPLAITGRPH